MSSMDLGLSHELYHPSEGAGGKVSRLQWRAQGPPEGLWLSLLHCTSSLPRISRASRPDFCKPHAVLAVSAMAFTLSGGSLCSFSAHPFMGLFLPPVLKLMKVSRCSRDPSLNRLTWCCPSPGRWCFGSWFYSFGWKKQLVGAFVGEHLQEHGTWGITAALGASPAGAGALDWAGDTERTHQNRAPEFMLPVRPPPGEMLSCLSPDVFPARLKICQKSLPHLPFPKLRLFQICL